jgi:hypothetical protein
VISEATLQIRGAASAQIAEATAQFLAAGGRIQEAPPLEYRPKPLIFCQSAPKIRTTKERVAVRREDAEKKASLINQVREAAQTMCLAEVIRALGIGRWALCSLAERNGIEFQPAPPTVDRSRDAADVERVKSAIQIGLSRTAVSRTMGIRKCRLDRLCDEYGIDFPKQGAFGK